MAMSQVRADRFVARGDDGDATRVELPCGTTDLASSGVAVLLAIGSGWPACSSCGGLPSCIFLKVSVYH